MAATMSRVRGQDCSRSAGNGIVEIGGPEQFRLDELVRRRLASLKDPREVIADPNARYSGAKIREKTLVPGKNARLGETRFEPGSLSPQQQIPSANAPATGVGTGDQEERKSMQSQLISPPRTPLVSGAWESTPAVERRPTHDEIAQLAFSL